MKLSSEGVGLLRRDARAGQELVVHGAGAEGCEGIREEDVDVVVHAAELHGAERIGGDPADGGKEKRGLRRLGRGEGDGPLGNAAVRAHVLAAGTDVGGKLIELGGVAAGGGGVEPLDDDAEGVAAGNEAGDGLHSGAHRGAETAELRQQGVARGISGRGSVGDGLDGNSCPTSLPNPRPAPTNTG